MAKIEIETDPHSPKFFVARGKEIREITSNPNDGLPEGYIAQLEFILAQRKRKAAKRQEVAA
jgi:hypothetical protein